MRTKYPIPVTKVRCKIGVGFLMVHIMFAGPSINAERYKVGCGPREIIATVILNRNVDMHNHEDPCSEHVASEDHRIQSGPKAHCDQLPATQALSKGR